VGSGRSVPGHGWTYRIPFEWGSRSHGTNPSGPALERWFDVVIVSCEVGVAKPDPVIFQMCLTRLGVKSSQVLFVDDRIENIEGAARLGIQTFHFIGKDAVSRLAEALGSLSR